MWRRTELSVGGNAKGLYTSAHKKFNNSFPHVKDEIRQRWMNMADTFALQSHQNVIVLGGIDIRDANMSVSLHLILLDQRKFGHFSDYRQEFLELDALTGKKTWNGDVQLELKYFGNSWRVQVADVTDELLDNLIKENVNSKVSKQDVVTAWNETGGFVEWNAVIIYWQNYRRRTIRQVSTTSGLRWKFEWKSTASSGWT